MRLWSEVRERVRSLLFRAQEEREMSEELGFHLEMETAQNIRDGMNPEQARRRAQQRLGGADQIKEEMREQRGTGWVDHASRDVRHAWRSIVRMPVLASVVVVSLGVGIGVNTAVFSWIQAMVLKPIPGVSGGADFHSVEPVGEVGHPGTSWLEYGDLRRRLTTFRELVAFRMVPLTVGEPGQATRSVGQLVSGNYFSGLGLVPAQGRFPGEEETARPGGEPVVVISHGFWQKNLGGGANALGQTLRVNGRPLTIIGIAPEHFQGTVLGLDFDLWVPASLAPVLLAGSRELEERGQRGYSMIGRLRADATREEAQAEVDAAMLELTRLYPQTNATLQAEVLPYWQSLRGPQRMVLGAVAILQAVLLLLLLAVCGNTANLMLARASTREQEMAVRRALGAGRWRIASLLLTENLLLGLLGAGLGVAIALWGTQALRAIPMIGAFPIRYQTSVDAVGLAFAVLLGIVCAAVFGLAPAVQLAGVDPQRPLRAGSSTRARGAVRSALMAGQVALAVVVLIVAGLFVRGFRDSRDTDPGFRREGLLLATYDLSGRGLDTSYTRVFAGALLLRLRAMPDIEAAAIASAVPLDLHGLPVRSFTLEGRARADAAPDQALANVVTPQYFEAMRIALVAGADFADLNDGKAPAQAIVNQEFVRYYLNGAPPIGRRLEQGGRTFEIVGVVRNTTYESFGEPPAPAIYFSYRDRPLMRGDLHLATRAGTEMLVMPEVRRIVRELDPSLPLYDVRTMNEHIEKNLFLRRIPARMFVVLGPLLLALAAIGIYAVVAYAVARRTAEIGLRQALGATAPRVVGEIVRDSMFFVGLGALTGWGLAFMVYIHLRAGEPIDLPSFFGVPAILILVAAFASWLPAQRATRVSPVVALRRE